MNHSEDINIRVDSDDLPVDEVDGVRVLRQNFEIPEGKIGVRMQVGEAPVTVIGWVSPGEGNVSALLRNTADELDKVERKLIEQQEANE
jgi:hypothetical protein